MADDIRYHLNGNALETPVDSQLITKEEPPIYDRCNKIRCAEHLPENCNNIDQQRHTNYAVKHQNNKTN